MEEENYIIINNNIFIVLSEIIEWIFISTMFLVILLIRLHHE